MLPLSLRQKIGQLFCLGFVGATLDKPNPIVQAITEENLGGVILFDRHLATKAQTNNIINTEQVAELTAALQQLAGNRLLIAVDQEGGKVSRFKEERGFKTTASAGELGKKGDPSITAASARQTARMLRGMGINFNLAPVVDINANPRNPIIARYDRSFSDKAEVVAAHAKAWIQAHHKEGVICCLKHFPGHGSSRADSHLGFVDVTETWNAYELEPYRSLIEEGMAEAVMVGHLFNKQIDSQLPASLSAATIMTLLRQTLHFSGAVLADDMQMKAITDQYRLEEACCLAIQAGVDFLIIGNNLAYDPAIFTKMGDAIEQAVAEGRLEERRINEAFTSVQQLKAQIGNCHA